MVDRRKGLDGCMQPLHHLWPFSLWTKHVLRKINHCMIKQGFFGFSMTHSQKQTLHQDWQPRQCTDFASLVSHPGAQLPLLTPSAAAMGQLQTHVPQAPLQLWGSQTMSFLTHLRPSAMMLSPTPSTFSLPRSCLFRQNQGVKFMDPS